MSSSDTDDNFDEINKNESREQNTPSPVPSHLSNASLSREDISKEDGSDSERSHASPSPMRDQLKRRLVDSSSDEDSGKSGPHSSRQGEVFGDEVSSDSDNAEGDVNKETTLQEPGTYGARESGDEDNLIQSLEGQPDAEAPKTIKLYTAEVPFKAFKRDQDLYHSRLPNFLSMATKQFIEESYEDIYDENEQMDEEGRNRLKLKIENTLRWRKNKEDEAKYESNAKIVKWSDGTMSLMIGGEIFECHDTRLLAPAHLYHRLPHGLTGLDVFEKRLKFRPSTTDSKTHKKVTMNMADRTKKSGQVRFIQEVGENPDDAKKDVIRREEEALRAAYRRERDLNTRRRDRDRGRMSSGFLEDRGDYSEDESPKRGRVRKEAPLIGASSDESEDDARRIEKSKEDTSDSDEEFRRSKQEKKKKIVSSDEESDDE